MKKLQIGIDTDSFEVTNNGLSLIAFTVGNQIEVKTVGISCLCKQRFGFVRIIFVSRRAFIGAAELFGEQIVLRTREPAPTISLTMVSRSMA